MQSLMSILFISSLDFLMYRFTDIQYMFFFFYNPGSTGLGR